MQNAGDGVNMVDEEHIQAFAEFWGDRFVNWLALCKNHHWAFDRGWFGVDDDYFIVTPWDRFMEKATVESREAVVFRGKSIGLPKERVYAKFRRVTVASREVENKFRNLDKAQNSFMWLPFVFTKTKTK